MNTRLSLRKKWMAEADDRAANNDNRNYATWLEDYIVDNSININLPKKRADIETLLHLHTPVLVRPAKHAKTTFVNVFTSNHARQMCLDAIVDKLCTVIGIE